MINLVSKAVLSEPIKLSFPDNWIGHIPLAFWLVEHLQPKVLVELGTHSGNSYFSFCQGVSANHLPTKCHAVDIWRGDEHAGLYDEEVFRDVSEHNERHYHAFSKLLRMTFDQAVNQFGDGTIDLLHIDGLHTYEAVKHDFELWRPKVSSQGVILFHDIAVRERGFGVWRLWEELSKQHPHVEFEHSNGLGVLFLGKERSAGVTEIIEDWHDPEGRRLIKQFFSKLGHCVEFQYQFSVNTPCQLRKRRFRRLKARLAKLF